MEEKKNIMENIVEREFKQTGEILTDIVGDFFKRVIQDPKGMGIEVKEFENSDTRLSLLKRDDRTIAGVVETRTEFNNVEFIKFSLYKDHPTTASGSVAAPKEEIVRVLRVAKRFVSEGADMLIDTDNQEAQSEFRAAERECQRLITKLTSGEKGERDEYEKNINEMVNRIFDAERKEKEYLKSLQSENTALREALKELLSIVDKSHELFLNDIDWAIIERARKLLNP